MKKNERARIHWKTPECKQAGSIALTGAWTCPRPRRCIESADERPERVEYCRNGHDDIAEEMRAAGARGYVDESNSFDGSADVSTRPTDVPSLGNDANTVADMPNMSKEKPTKLT